LDTMTIRVPTKIIGRTGVLHECVMCVSRPIIITQSARIAICLGNSTPLPSSGASQNNQSNSNATILPINIAAHNILSLAKLDRTAHACTCYRGCIHMGWLRFVGSLKLYVPFAKEPYKRDDILQKRATIACA